MVPSSITEPSVIGSWERISDLGSGGFGKVTLWSDRKSNDSIAVKKCKLQCSSSLTPKQKDRWRNEVQIMKELDHSNIIKYKPLPPVLEEELLKWNPTKLPLLPMEYCQKGNLRHVLTQPYNMCGLEEKRVRNILYDISSAVQYLHSNKITHRDIKPENIVLQDCPMKPEKVIYKLIDLGYAKELGDSTGSFVGTHLYLAPEIFANVNYSQTVDYWSFGVMAFEVICGVPPFMSRLPPAERYNLIRGKKSEDICIFKNQMGNFEYSSKLFEENRISCCLKDLMETWLQKALQFDPVKRGEPFPGSNNFFEYLNHILRKKILNVFVVSRYKFFSYEFDECTLLSTVSKWIRRDTGIVEENQLLLGSFQFVDCNNQTLIANCFIDEDYKLFLFERHTLFQVDKHYNPRLVKLMFNKCGDEFRWEDLKAIYSHCIHYIQHDILMASVFSEAMDLYLKQVTMIFNKILKIWELSRQKLMKLTKKVTDFNGKIKNGSFKCNDASAGTKLMKVLESIEKCVQVEHNVAEIIQKWQVKLDAMRSIDLVAGVIKLPQLKESLEKATLCLKMTATTLNQRRNNLRCGDMLRIVSKVIKLKDTMFLDRNLKDYTRYLGKATDYLSGTLSPWIVSFDAHVVVLDQLFDLAIVKTADEHEEIRRGSTSIELCAIRKPSVIEGAVEQTELLGSRFAELIGESIASYRTIRDEIESYIEDISALL